MPAVTVKHWFEAAHRLPHIPGKCVSLHGHSWHVEISAEAPGLQDGMVLDFGSFKRAVRDWIDLHLDHGTMLGPEDPLLPILAEHHCKTYTVPGWPTVENVAALIADRAQQILGGGFQVLAPGTRITRVHLAETHVNAATWTAP